MKEEVGYRDAQNLDKKSSPLENLGNYTRPHTRFGDRVHVLLLSYLTRVCAHGVVHVFLGCKTLDTPEISYSTANIDILP